MGDKIMKIKWITHACFQITTNDNIVIYFDPYEIKSGEAKADIILVSHDHYDHTGGLLFSQDWPSF